ncbi:MAG: hypothetical protein JSV80_15370 [Acidobacteriota bacterium]|nr:MAG: hypothetical protein JSV80_15370 [Acidobacteriota bacterium]
MSHPQTRAGQSGPTRVPERRVPRSRRAYFAFLAALSVGLSLPALATDYFVRLDGSDACNGRADQPSGSGDCAFRTIAKANTSARCGDTVHIGEGSFGEERIRVTDSCPQGTEKVFRGSGRDRTRWMAVLVDLDDEACVPAEGTGGVYRCPRPAGSISSSSPITCFVQRHVDSVYFEDENGVKGDMVGPVCVTWNTTGQSDVAGKEGNVYATATDYFIRPWDDRSPASGVNGTDFWAPGACGSDSNAGVQIEGSGIVIGNLTLQSSCGKVLDVRNNSSRALIEDVDFYTGTIWVYAGSSGTTLRRVRILNAYRRPVNMGAVAGANAWNTHSQSLVMQGRDFLLEDIETYASREGAGFSAGAQNGVVNGGKFHGHHNHGLKIIDTSTGNLTFRDVFTYNSQEAVFIECPYNVKFENSTLPGKVLVQGNATGCGPDRPSNLDFFNNAWCGIVWFQYGGDTWAKGGHDLDHNLYISDWANCYSNSYYVRHIASDTSFTSFGSWQNWASDPCADCTRDPHSRTDTVANTWVRYANRDDTVSANYDFDLNQGAKAIDAGSSQWGDSRDIDGVLRTGAPDAGAWEHESSSSPACSDSTDNDGDGAIDLADSNCSGPTDNSESLCGDGVAEGTAETCDGSDLKGESCVSQGFSGGTLGCAADCLSFDTSSCTTNDPPETVSGLRRTDTRNP